MTQRRWTLTLQRAALALACSGPMLIGCGGDAEVPVTPAPAEPGIDGPDPERTEGRRE